MNTLKPSPAQADLIRRTLRLDPAEPLPALTPVEGGITNSSFRFQCRGEDCILREPGTASESCVSRGQEAASYRAILPLEVSDEVLALEPETGRKISRFWENARIADPRNPEDVKRCMAMLRRLHGCGAVVSHRTDLFSMCRLFLDWMPEKSVYPNHPEVLQRCMDMEPVLAQYAEQTAIFCHCDAVAANLLFFPRDGREELRLIDWEYSGMADPAIDLGTFAADADYTPEETEALLRCYLEKEPDPVFMMRVYGYLALAALTWSNGEEVFRAQGMDYGDYGQKKFQSARLYSRLFWELLSRIESEAGYGSD